MKCGFIVKRTYALRVYEKVENQATHFSDDISTILISETYV